MQQSSAEQWIMEKNLGELSTWIDAFLVDRKSQNLSKTTLYFYHMKMLLLKKFTMQEGIVTMADLTAEAIRRYLLWLEQTNHNPGGVNACYRVLKTFLLWYQDENDLDGWKNPIRKIKAPKLSKEMMAPIELKEVTAMIAACPDNYMGIRDKALFLLMLDTGARASEICSMDKTDFDDAHGNILIRHGKGGKTRTVYLGKRTRKALRVHLRRRSDQEPALLTNHERERLTYHALQQAVKRAARRAHVQRATPHMFRRAFALNCLRAGMDVYSLKELMGHEDLQVLQRYLKLTKGDVEAAHHQFAPVDRMMGN